MTTANRYTEITKDIASIPISVNWKLRFWIGFSIAFLFVLLLLYAVVVLFVRGVGIWGISIPVAWGFAIVNFVWWVGIGHAGTFISAFLLLLKQDWRNSINRCAEAMTLFAIACAGLFPLLHLGNPDLFYWLLPYPNTISLGPQFRSPLIWDIFAILAYLTVSFLFWFLGLIPDLAMMRDQAKSLTVKRLYGFFALGWRGSARHWRDLKTASLLIAGIATPLVISVHSIVSMDFSAAIVSGWHSTIFPPFFVAGALYSGFSMVLTILIPTRRLLHLESYITLEHFKKIIFIMIATGTMVSFGYTSEVVLGLYSGDFFEKQEILVRSFGPYAAFYWTMVGLNVTIPFLLWFPQVRKNLLLLFVLSLFANIGMWLERFIIVVVSLSRGFIPSEAQVYAPTRWDWFTYLGTLGLFFSLLFIFVRLLPLMAAFELKSQAYEREK
jgi:molybdopterin-containing oxidoreductase family membrane subunit